VRPRRVLLTAACLTALAGPSAALADSVFGIRGLGLLGRPLSGRAAATGGGFALFDAASALNPSSLAQWLGPAGWGIGAASARRFSDGSTSASLGSTRFPLFGFAVPAGQRIVVGLAVSEYLDRTWSVATTHDSTVRDSSITLTDVAASTGGVTDLRLGAAYRINPSFVVGLGFHTLVGSTQLSIERSFSDSGFIAFKDYATTSFTGVGVSLGAQGRLGDHFAVAGAVRFNGRLKASADDGTKAMIAMPVELNGGVMFAPVRGVGFAATVGYRTWARAANDLVAVGRERSRSVWNVAVGSEIDAFDFRGQRVPLRVGYRWRQLPFPVAGAALSEHAFSGGLGLTLAGGRATVDAGVDIGSRSAGSSTEKFTTGFVGVIVRP
jgi:hypothetical protein